jgi:hypothetical protein
VPLTDQALTDHPLWATRDQVVDLLTRVTEHADGPGMAEVGRMTEALAAVGKLAELPSWRFPQDGAALSNLNSAMSQAQSTLQNVVNNPDGYAATMAANLAANIDTIAQYLLTCPVPAVSNGYLKGIVATAADYRQLVDDAMGNVQAKLDEAQAAVTATVRARSESESNATAALEDLKAVIAQSKAEVTSQASRLDTAITEQGTAFNTLGVSWQKQIDEAITASERNAETSIVAADKAGVDQRAKYQAAADEHLKSLATLEKQARGLVDVTARNTISIEYAQYARRQGGAATAWSIVAVLVAIGGFVYISLLLRNFAGVSTAEAIFKSTASAAILGAAGFMGREAAGHRREARDAKRTQLDLNALEPFLANLPAADAEGLRIKFANRIFHRPLANTKLSATFDRSLGRRSNGESQAEET